jgi:hypothetical protein
LARDLGRDALPDLALGQWTDEQVEVGVRVDVDEPGGDGQIAAVDLDGSRSSDSRSDVGDAVARDQHVGCAGRGSGAVVHNPPTEQRLTILARP